MKAEEVTGLYEKETGKKHWRVNPVCDGEGAYASWEYQRWLQQKYVDQQQEIELLKEQRDGWQKEYSRLIEVSNKTIESLKALYQAEILAHNYTKSELSRIREGSVKLPVYKARLFDNNLEFNVCRVIDLDTLINKKGER